MTVRGPSTKLRADLVKREALEAGAKHEAPGSGTKYALRRAQGVPSLSRDASLSAALHEEHGFLAISSLDCARDPELCRRATNRHESCGLMPSSEPTRKRMGKPASPVSTTSEAPVFLARPLED